MRHRKWKHAIQNFCSTQYGTNLGPANIHWLRFEMPIYGSKSILFLLLNQYRVRQISNYIAINWYTKLIHFNFACLDFLHSTRHPCIWIRGHQSQAAINMCLNVLRLIPISGPLILWVCFELSKYSKYFEFTNSRSLMRKRWHS